MITNLHVPLRTIRDSLGNFSETSLGNYFFEHQYIKPTCRGRMAILEVNDMVNAKRQMVFEEIRRLDPNLKEDDPSFLCAAYLLSASIVGTDRKVICRFLGISSKGALLWDKNLRQNKVFVGDKIFCEWFDKKSGSIAFWMDVCVAEGILKKVFDKKKVKE